MDANGPADHDRENWHVTAVGLDNTFIDFQTFQEPFLLYSKAFLDPSSDVTWSNLCKLCRTKILDLLSRLSTIGKFFFCHVTSSFGQSFLALTFQPFFQAAHILAQSLAFLFLKISCHQKDDQ